VEKKVLSLRARLTGETLREFDGHVDLVRRYVIFREDAKDFLMMGYDLLRDVVLEAGRRLKLPAEEICSLTRAEMGEALMTGSVPRELLDQRRLEYRAEEKISLPQVIDAGAIETLGREVEREPERAGAGHKAFAISRGEAVGLARILTSPTDPRDLGAGYVLVCPSTDPSWTPLFVNAAALVLECGGTLSHGAVVAREMGLPAVVLPGATKLFKDGEAVHVDGRHGWVGPAAEKVPRTMDELPDPENVAVPARLMPPPAGRKYRRAAKIRNWCAAAWAVFLIAFFFLPASVVKIPALAVMDAVLWPIVRAWGKPAVVIVIAVLVAAVTLVLQRLMTDNRRLLEAKKRAAALKKEADGLPDGSRRRTALLGLVNAVTLRTLLAAMVPVGILLGPMVMPFVWMQERIDPNVQVGAAGAPVQVVAMVASDYEGTVTFRTGALVTIDPSTPADQRVRPIRKTLEQLRALYRQPATQPEGQPWELTVAPDLARQQALEDLEAYLKAGVPPQPVSWRVIPPDDFTGEFLVGVSASGDVVHAKVVLGSLQPPAQAVWTGAGPVKELRVVYAKSAEKRIFWRPLAFLGGKIGQWDIGWVWLYIVAYLPVLFGMRWLLKVA
jgi:pyruvate,water dikinase